MFFSVIMPIFNAEKYMDKAIKSVLMQTYNDFELILIDDGSTDNSGQMVEMIAKGDTRVISFHQKNSGPSSARNTGISKARGDYLLFIDSDDEFVQDALKLIYEQLKDEPVDFMCFGYKAIKKLRNKFYSTQLIPSNKTYKTKQEISYNLLQIINQPYFNSVWNKVYKTSLIKENVIFMRHELPIGEDMCFNLEVIDKCSTYREIDLLLYKYLIQNENSIIKRYNSTKFEQMLRIHDFRSNLVLNNNNIPENQIKADIQINYIRMCFSCFMDMFRTECPWSFKEKISFIKKIKEKELNPINIDTRSLSLKKRIIRLIFLVDNSFFIYFFSYIFYSMKFKSKYYKAIM